jgi:hypothetical protein
MARTTERPPAGNVVALASRLDALEAMARADHERIDRLSEENTALRQYAGRTRGMLMTGITAIASLEHHVGLAPPQRKAPPTPLKMFAFDSGWSESGLRKAAWAAEAAGRPFAELIGGKWFVIDPALAPAKRKYRRRKEDA